MLLVFVPTVCTHLHTFLNRQAWKTAALPLLQTLPATPVEPPPPAHANAIVRSDRKSNAALQFFGCTAGPSRASECKGRDGVINCPQTHNSDFQHCHWQWDGAERPRLQTKLVAVDHPYMHQPPFRIHGSEKYEWQIVLRNDFLVPTYWVQCPIHAYQGPKGMVRCRKSIQTNRPDRLTVANRLRRWILEGTGTSVPSFDRLVTVALSALSVA